MKNIFLVAGMIIMLALPLTARGQLTIGYIDLQKVMVESDKGKQAKQTLTQEAEKLKKNLDTKQDELQKMKDAIEKQGTTITPEARTEREKQYQNKLKDYQRLANDYQTELQQKDMEVTQKMLKDLEEVIKSVGEKDKYTLIVEKSQVLFATPAIDITPKIITLFNEAAKKKPAPVSAPAKK
jgi:outer membrane protein